MKSTLALPLTLAAMAAQPAMAQDELADFLEATSAETVKTQPEPRPIAASELKEAGGTLPTITESPEEVPGLADLHARGIQGEVGVGFIVQSDGAITNAKITRSSYSHELDKVALDLVALFVAEPGKDAEGKAVAVSVQMPLSFWKDSLASGQLMKKTCADYVIDADWFLANNKTKAVTLTDMRIWKLTLGTYVLTHKDGFAAKQPKAQDVYDACAKKPKAKFYETFTKEA